MKITLPPCREERTHRSSGRVLSSLLLFLPVAGLLGVALYQRAAPARDAVSYGEPTQPDRTGQVVDIPGWEGRVQRSGAAPLVVRLERLHPRAERQAFDAIALQGVEGLAGYVAGPALEASGDADAEPWRLTVSVVAARGSDPNDSAEVIGDVSQIRLAGLVPIATGAEIADERDSIDPIVALFAFPDAPLFEGESCDLVFWGSEPQGSVRAVIPGLADGLELRAQTRSANQSSSSIARTDARPQRKPGPSHPGGSRSDNR